MPVFRQILALFFFHNLEVCCPSTKHLNHIKLKIANEPNF